MLKKILLITIFAVALLSLFPNCAKVVTPTGGPKDTIPPALVNSIPKPNAINFRGEKLVLEFDEFLALKDVQQKLLVSPPLNNRPQIKPKGKRIELEIKDTLLENTTYTVYFGDAIRDNNENNAIPNFEFAFSTGPTIDTASLAGTIVNSFTNEPVEGALIMLYSSFADSLPYIKRPTHMAKSGKNGRFKVNNLKNIDYKLVAITDANGNYLYNQGIEDIAFVEGKVTHDMLMNASDSSTWVRLRTFSEPLPYQLLTGTNRPQRDLIELNFSRKPVGGFKLVQVDNPVSEKWYIPEPDNEGDTVKLWIISEKISAADTLKLALSYLKTDSLNMLQPRIDTLRFVYYESEEAGNDSRSKRGKKEEVVKPTGFKVETSIKNMAVAIPGVPFEFTLPSPARKVNGALVQIFNQTDSILEPGVKLVADSINPRIYRFNTSWKPNVTYKMIVLPGAFESYTSTLNDTLKLQLTGADPESFGTLTAKFSGVSKAVVAELLTEKDAVVDRKAVVGNQSVTFTFIAPAKYKLRFIDDLNANGTWDSGNYLKRIQPERVIPFTEGKNKGVINIRANWDNEISVSLQKP